MSIDVPDKFDGAYLVDHLYDVDDWPAYICDHYIDIIQDFDVSRIPFACASLAYPLINKISRLDNPNESFDMNMCAIDIIRYGINFTRDEKYSPSDLVDAQYTLFLKG